MGFGVTWTGRIGRESQRSGERVNLNLCGGVPDPSPPAVALGVLSGQPREASTARLPAVLQTGPGAFHASSESREALGLRPGSGQGRRATGGGGVKG